MKWEKLGLIIKPRGDVSWLRTHAMVPTVDYLNGDLIRVFFSGRDDQNRSRIGYVVLDLKTPENIVEWSKQPVLDIGELGCFDDNGVTPSWIVNDREKKFLYYIGWKPRSTTRMSVVAGLAISEDGGKSFTRISRAPLLRLTDTEPFSILTAPCVLNEGGLWRMWYVSGVEWVTPDLPRYNIKYAESKDGINWEQWGIVCLDNKPGVDVALARPCVLKEDDRYRMWYSMKNPSTSYRIGYAESKNGLDWTRMDEEVGINVSETGWDSEMIEYAFVIKHNARYYMFYNGNNYGYGGVGLAVSV